VISLPDRYKLRGHLANGGMAGVWEAEDQRLGRTVAVKVLSAHLAEDPVNLGRFQREARAAARLSSHPNVVTVFDVGEHDGRAFIVMERMAGGTLADRLRAGGGGGMEIDEILDWLEEAASALDFGHEHGVVHRDVKPANLLLDAAGHLHVGDFGIARIATEDTMTTSGQLIGTAAYLSPEQVKGEPATPASDCYSLGIVAFELLTGRRPFGAENVAAQARQHLEAEPPRASEVRGDLPPAVDPVLSRALAKDPGERWPTCTAFVMALERALGQAPAPPPAPRPEPPTTRTIPLRPRPAPAVAAPAPPPERRRSRRAPLLVLLGALALGAAVAAVLLSGGDGASTTTPGNQAGRSTPTHRQSRSVPTSTTPGTTTPTAPPATSPTTTTTTPTTSGSASALEARGHALLASDPAGAVPVLQQAARATGRSTDECLQPAADCLTYAYALFDLGHALRLAGRPAEAVPILQDRLRIDNSRATVQAELAAAQAAAGGGTTGGKEKTGKAKGHPEG
jgi:serine/threonine protein kinase